MKYSVDKQDRYCVLQIQEEKLDTTFAPDLKSEFISLNAEGFCNIIFDMSEVKYTDSSGLSAILVANRLCSNSNGLLVLSGLNDHVQKLIDISQLNNVLHIVPTKEEAVEAIFMNDIENEINEEGED